MRLDHVVIAVTDFARSNAFYRDVVGAEVVEIEGRVAYRIGEQQLNVHGPGVRPAMVARVPVAPGNSDLCFEWDGPIDEAAEHLRRHGVAVAAGPMPRAGAKGRGTSVYFHDLDGSLLEFISYRDR
ncbi:MAG TPA: VOC family protein [Candidatus Limnocylindria bacterium]|nr:VOC family protein [Candidatus Limnocylindria bacterium]